MNRIDKTFKDKQNKLLTIYFTAGHPNINDTATIIEALAKVGTDIIEIGMPFSDPVADGPVIQQSSLKALNNGMSLKLIFEQLEGIQNKVDVPLILMGYLNPVLQYGIENFCKKCDEIGIDGVILPDLPPDLYVEQYKSTFNKYGIANVLLVPPQTSDDRIKELDELSEGFLYIVSSSSTTGAKSGFQDYQLEYFDRLKSLNLKTPTQIGFGISNNESFTEACKHANGAIIGSAFIKELEQKGVQETTIHDFVKSIKGV